MLKRLLVLSALTFLLLVIASMTVVHLATMELIRPQRSELQAYHREWLNHPAAHGITIQRHTFAENSTPCIIVEPARTLWERGIIIRQQLPTMGVHPLPFGTLQGQLVLTRTATSTCGRQKSNFYQ